VARAAWSCGASGRSIRSTPARSSFICSSEATRFEYIHSKLGGRSVLTVGETKDFASRYGIVGFDVQRNRLRLRINVAAADSAKLTISSKLLRQAELVPKG